MYPFFVPPQCLRQGWLLLLPFFLILLGGGNVLVGQTPPPEINFCGAIVKPPLDSMQTAQYYDRFGNAYTDADFPYPGDASGAYRLSCNSGYFDLTFVGYWTPNEEQTICHVFDDLSLLIDNPAEESVNILVEKISLDNDILGTGSPIWEADCGIADSRIVQRLNNALSTSYLAGYLGYLQIDDAALWHTISDDTSVPPDFGIASNEFDLYSVALHEALHILGFGSQISLSGNPLNGFFSRWDGYLFSIPENAYLINATPNPNCCSTHIFNSTTFGEMPDDLAFGCPLQLSFHPNGGVNLAPVNVANYTTFSGSSGEGLFLNKLSHLDKTCADEIGITPTPNYVMHPGISAAEIRRNITEAELEILCALGYHIIEIPGVATCEQNCEIYTNPDTYQIYLQGASANNPLTIPFYGTGGILGNDILPADINNMDISIDFDCLYTGDLTITSSSASIVVTGTSTGVYTFCYTVSGLNSCGGYCSIQTVTILVNNSPIETQCNDPYCNIICFGDFEDFATSPTTNDNYFNQFLPENDVSPYQFEERLNSPDVLAYNGNNVLHLFRCEGGCDWETVSLPLSAPIPPDCEVTISFDAVAINQYHSNYETPNADPTLLFTALSDYPCSSFPFLGCTEGDFSVCSGILASNMTSPSNNCGLNLTPVLGDAYLDFNLSDYMSSFDFSTAPHYTFSWTNTTTQNITTILMSVFNTATGVEAVGSFQIYIDNLVAVLECEKKVTITASDQDDICRNSAMSIPYTLCFENAQPGDVINTTLQTNVAAIPGLTVIPGGAFSNTGTAQVTLTYDQPCATVNLMLYVGPSFTDGQQVAISAQPTNIIASGDTPETLCTDYHSEGWSITLTIIDCEPPIEPPYDCLSMTNFFTVNAGTPEVFILSEFGQDRNSYSPPATQTWEPGSHPFTAITGGSSDLSFNVDLVIPAGTYLTINNMNLFFAPDKRILVQPGATLNLNYTTIDGVCQTMWTGIQVQGPGMDIAPNPTNAGKLNMYQSELKNTVIGAANMNLATLNNAAIATIAPPDNPYFNISSLALAALFADVPAKATSGGLLNINSSFFTNCFQGINISWNNLLPYSFQHNEFRTDAPALWYPFTTLTPTPEAGIYALWCDRVGVFDCFFKNQKYGVRANFVNRLTVNESKFEDDQVGISTRNYKNFMTQYSNIFNNEFTDCRLSVQADGNELCRITGNQVNETGNSILAYSGQTTAGFYFRGSNVYCVNNFLHRTHIGIILNQGDVDGTLIAGNLINNTAESVIVEGDNAQAQLWCNHILDYTLHGLDLRAFAPSNGILPQQGDCDINAPAANTFMAATGFGISDIRLGPELFGGFAVQDLLYHDVDASSLSVTDLSLSGNYVSEDCPTMDLNPYCLNQGYTPFSDVSDYVGLENMSDQDLAQEILRLLADSSYTYALDLLHQYNTRLIAQRRLIPYYIGTDSLAMAQNLLNQINATKEEDLRFIELNQLLLDLRADNRTIFEITQQEEAQLLDIANSGTKTSYKAQAILYAVRGTDFPVVLPNLASGGGNWYTSFKTMQDKISAIYPNPSNHTATLSYDLDTGEAAIFILYSPVGQILDTATFIDSGKYLIDVHKYTAGLYFYSVTINGSPVTINKFLIVK